MISFLLYGFSIALLVIASICIGRRLFFRWQKVCLIGVSCLLLVSAVYHTVYYGKPVFKAAIDQEGFYYYRQICEADPFENQNLTEKLLTLGNSIIHLHRNNLIYPLLYWTIKDIFGTKYFLEGFFLACILNSILFLFSVYWLFKILNCFKVSKYFLWLCLFIFFQPFMIARNALPLANSLTIFSVILFFYTEIFSKRVYLKILCCLLMFLAHKTLWLPSLVGVIYLFLKEKTFTKKPIKVLTILFFLTWIVMSNLSVSKNDINSAENCFYGNSYIPPAPVYKKILNYYFSPLNTNLNLFFYKRLEGSWLGWIYAIYINFIVLCMFIKICFLFRNYFHLPPQMKQIANLSGLFIISFFLEGARLTNYLNGNRHATNSLIVWILLMLVLESGKNIKSHEKHKSDLLLEGNRLK